MVKGGTIPTFFVEADSIPEAHYKALSKIWEEGMNMRTQYDRRNDDGSFVDPPGKDARVLISVRDPFSEPRFPPLSFSERGKYILELLGVKDENVIPREELIRGIDEEAPDTRWPYTYSGRLINHPTSGGPVDQISGALERLVEDPISRRAVMTTRSAEIDNLLKVDIPCLGEVHLRAPEDENGVLTLNMTTYWRSRDFLKAWADNTIAITYMGRRWADRLSERLSRPVSFKGYADMSTSAHIYGQNFVKIEGKEGSGKMPFFERFPDAQSYIAASMPSSLMTEAEILPQMRELLKETDQWGFGPDELATIKGEIAHLEAGNLA